MLRGDDDVEEKRRDISDRTLNAWYGSTLAAAGSNPLSIVLPQTSIRTCVSIVKNQFVHLSISNIEPQAPETAKFWRRPESNRDRNGFEVEWLTTTLRAAITPRHP